MVYNTCTCARVLAFTQMFFDSQHFFISGILECIALIRGGFVVM